MKPCSFTSSSIIPVYTCGRATNVALRRSGTALRHGSCVSRLPHPQPWVLLAHLAEGGGRCNERNDADQCGVRAPCDDLVQSVADGATCDPRRPPAMRKQRMARSSQRPSVARDLLTRRKHRVRDEDAVGPRELFGKLVEVHLRLQRLLVPVPRTGTDIASPAPCAAAFAPRVLTLT